MIPEKKMSAGAQGAAAGQVESIMEKHREKEGKEGAPVPGGAWGEPGSTNNPKVLNRKLGAYKFAVKQKSLLIRRPK